jgi:hypothetical protein
MLQFIRTNENRQIQYRYSPMLQVMEQPLSERERGMPFRLAGVDRERTGRLEQKLSE